MTDYVPATLKTMVFGFIIATVSSYLGFTTSSGTEGVGRASTRGVVLASILIIVSNVILVRLIFLRVSAGGWRVTMPPAPAAAGRSGTHERPRRAGSRPIVRLEHVTKTFGQRCVLDDVSFEVPEGAGFVILGRSGTGKSVDAEAHRRAGAAGPGPRVRRRRRDQRARRGRSCRASGRRWVSCSRTPRCSIRFRSARTSRSRCAGTPNERRGGSGQRAGRSSPRSGSGANTTRCRRTCRVACASGRVSRARWRSIPSSCSSTSRAPGSIRSPRPRSTSCCLDLKQRGGTTLVVVTHNIPSARRLGDRLLVLHEGHVAAQGTPADLDRSPDEIVRAFMSSQNAG